MSVDNSGFRGSVALERSRGKDMRFPVEIILLCIRGYAAYPVSYRHLEEMMEDCISLASGTSLARDASATVLSQSRRMAETRRRSMPS